MEINQMIANIIENEEYKNLVCKQVKETIEYLLDNNQEFSITANIEGMKFNPELPKSIKEQLAKFSLFILSNYTYTTIEINDDFEEQANDSEKYLLQAGLVLKKKFDLGTESQYNQLWVRNN